MKKLCLFIMLAFFMPATAAAQEPPEGEKSQQIIDELKRLTDRAERDRTASYRFIDQLRELIDRYDWPWGRQILFDDFRDGDFRSNPAWQSDSNAFWVTRSVGLRTELAPYRNNGGAADNQSTEEALLGILIEGPWDSIRTKEPPPAILNGRISTPLCRSATPSPSPCSSARWDAAGRRAPSNGDPIRAAPRIPATAWSIKAATGRH